LEDEAGVVEEAHHGSFTTDAADFFPHEKGTFHDGELLEALEADPDSVLVITARPLHLNVADGEAEDDFFCLDRLEVPAMGLLYLVDVRDYGRVSLRFTLPYIQVPEIVHFVDGIRDVLSNPVLDEFPHFLFTAARTVNLVELFEKFHFLSL
jgi:hypothetical protein